MSSIPDAQFRPGERVGWCPASRTFYEENGGSEFDIDGYVIGGPARAGLDRYATSRRGEDVVVDLERRIPGPPIDAKPVRPQRPPAFTSCSRFVPAPPDARR